MSVSRLISRLLIAVGLLLSTTTAFAQTSESDGYAALVKLFGEWRAFEQPVMTNNVPDYGTAALGKKAAALPAWQQRLQAINTQGWSKENLIDYQLVKAEMNGLDFDLRVLRPWARDPGYYATFWPEQTDVPSRDGPTAFPEINLFTYSFPLSAADQKVLTAQIGAIPALLAQARENLKDSNARDLWRFSLQRWHGQVRALTRFEQGTLTVSSLDGDKAAPLTSTSAALRRAVKEAREASESFATWIEAETPKKTGPSGVGKDNYNWYLKNVQLEPYSWDEEVTLLRRELERAHASLKLEEHRNRNLPPLEAAASAQAYDQLAENRLGKFVDFLVKQDILVDKGWLRKSLEPHKGSFVPLEQRTFFANVTHRDPMPLYSHDYHWIDLWRIREEPHASPIRRVPSLSNIFDLRAEGFATGFEEMMMHAGLYDDNPRGRELVWIMLANRAARGLASLYVQSNEWSLEEAGHFHATWTPRGWANAKDDLTAFEQLLYLRQPGYGTSYITGKILFERLMADYSHQLEQQNKPFSLKDFITRVNDAGMIPVTLVEQEMVGK